MPYFVDSGTTFLNGAVTAVAQTVPPHQIDDILVMFVTVDTGAITIASSSSTWNVINASVTATGVISGAWWVRATTANETIALTTADAYTSAIYCIRDVDVTTPLDGVTPSFTGIGTATSSMVSTSVTSTTANTFVLYCLGVDGVATMAHSDPGVMAIGAFDSQGTTATTSAASTAAWYFQRAAGAVPAPTWTSSASAQYTQLTLVLRNKAGGIVPAYIDDVTSPATTITPGHHIGALNNISFPTALTSTAAINGKTRTYSAAIVGADFGINPYSNALSKTSAIVAKTVLAGFEIALTGNRDLSTGILMGSLIAATPKTATYSLGAISDGGFVVSIGSSATAWAAYQVAAKDSVPTTESRAVFAIQPGYVGTTYGTPGTAVTTTAVSHLQFLLNCPALAALIYTAEVYQVRTQVIAGGTSLAPVDTDGVASVGRSFRLPVIQKFGGSGLLSYAPIQIGGGDAVDFQIDAGALQFPRRYSVAKKEISFHAADNAVGISYAGKVGDVIKHTNSVITSPTPYYFNINGGATSAATWDFTGLVVVGANVTLRNVMTFDGMSFSGCPTLDFSGCALTRATISNVSPLNDSLVTSPTTSISNSSINVTKVTVGNRLASSATPAIFSNTTFTGSATSGHAIRLTAIGTYTLSGLTFSGFDGVAGSNGVAASGSNSAAIFNDSGGAITLSLSGGTSPSIRNGVGATTVVSSSTNLTLTGLPVGTDIVILDAGTTTILQSVDSHTATSYVYTYSGTPTVDIGFIKVGFVPFYIRGLALTLTPASIPVSLTSDRNFV